MILRLILPFLILLTLPALAQIDVRQYASDDLFAVKPIVATGHSEEGNTGSWAQRTYERALDHLSAGNTSEALADLDELIEYDRENPMPHYLQGVIHMENGMPAEARQKFNDALRAEPLFLEAKYMLGMLALEEEDRKTAKEYFKGLTEIKRYAAYGYHGLGLEALYRGSASGAIRNFEKCIEADSTFLDAYNTLVTVCVLSGNLNKGQKVLMRGIRMDSTWEEGIMMHAILAALVHDDIDVFENDINRLIELSPGNYHYLFMRAGLLMEKEQWHAALLQYREAYQLDTTRNTGFRFTSRIHREKAVKESIDYFFAHNDMADPTRRHIEQALCELIRNNGWQAWKQIQEANEQEETRAGLLAAAVIAEKTLKSPSSVMDAYTKAIEVDTMNAYAYFRRGDLLLAEERFEEAYVDYDKLVTLFPEEKEAWKKRGLALTRMEYPKHAYRDFSRALALDTTDLELYFNRAAIARELKEFDNARMDLAHLLEQTPEDGEAWYLYYTVGLDRGDTLSALSRLDSASKYLRERQEVHEELLGMARLTGHRELCLEALTRLIRSDSRHYRFLLDRGILQYELGRPEEAVQDLEQFLDKDKQSAEGHYYLGRAYQQLGEEKKSERHLKRAEKYGYVNK